MSRTVGPLAECVAHVLHRQRRPRRWLAEQIGITEKHMSGLMGGQVQLTIRMAVAIERALPELTAEGLLLIDLMWRVPLERQAPAAPVSTTS